MSEYITWGREDGTTRVPKDVLECTPVGCDQFLAWLNTHVTVRGEPLVTPSIEYVNSYRVATYAIASNNVNIDYTSGDDWTPMVTRCTMKVATESHLPLLFQVAHEYSHMILHQYVPLPNCYHNEKGVGNPKHNEEGVNALAWTLIYEYLQQTWGIAI